MDKEVLNPVVDRFFDLWEGMPPVAGLFLMILGIAYLFFGKWLFRVFVAGIGIGAGMEIGRIIAENAEIAGPWIPLASGALIGGLAWPLWQIVVFATAGAMLGFALGEVVHSVEGQERFYLLAVSGGFIAGGLFAIMLMNIAAVVLSAVAGAFLLLAGITAAGAETIPFLAKFAEPGFPRIIFLVAAIIAGMVFQGILPSADTIKEKRKEREAARKKADEEADKKRRYDRFIKQGL